MTEWQRSWSSASKYAFNKSLAACPRDARVAPVTAPAQTWRVPQCMRTHTHACMRCDVRTMCYHLTGCCSRCMCICPPSPSLYIYTV